MEAGSVSQHRTLVNPQVGFRPGPVCLGDAPRTVVEELAKIKSGDVVLPALSASGQARQIRLRCVTEPDAPQKALLSRLGLTLPRRLRRLQEVSQM
jgi:hypothetical protein